MLDKNTNQRIVVRLHEENGPYIVVSDATDAQALQHLFDARYFVLYWIDTPDELRDQGGCRVFFGNGASVAKVQAILDEIE
ncbi:hypothetical protein [Pseudoduganella armeniaca]|uniref:Uncharacterized protein n=1 Tax=Pseudoduganella armeniaca TaxID=2072590 RepID=A0A2R4C6C1_9BURK|nr:hypothetical protein [Pseudoduganella armeniaca]AVR95088.1 hypothetical protein C9I28_04655 [Pseudoduganella armeniaca]